MQLGICPITANAPANRRGHYLESDITYDDYLKGALFSE